MSIINPRLKYNFFAFVIFTWIILGLNGCKEKKNLSPQDVLQNDLQLENVIKMLDEPPLTRELYTPASETYQILDTFKSTDKDKNSHRHYYIHAATPLKIETLEGFLQKNPENVHWIYLSPDTSALKQNNDKAFTSFARCIKQPFSGNNLSTVLFFKVAYTYKGSAFSCDLSYYP